MLMQVGYEGFTTTMIEGIMDHDRDETTAVYMKNKYVRAYSNQNRLRKSTAGWKLKGQIRVMSTSERHKRITSD
eukprot:11774340-Ditylum_brightwellii.AAC.1